MIYFMKRKNLRATGRHFERLAGNFLAKQGLQILEYNYRCARAEIDIIARDGNCLVFCEVKSRVDSSGALPECADDLILADSPETTGALEAVTPHKQAQISRAALYYLTAHGMTDAPCRFDVIGITGRRLTWIKNAFDYTKGV